MSRSRHHGCACSMCKLSKLGGIKPAREHAADRDGVDGLVEFECDREERGDGYDYCNGGDCWLCGDETWRTEPLPDGVALIEAAS